MNNMNKNNAFTYCPHCGSYTRVAAHCSRCGGPLNSYKSSKRNHTVLITLAIIFCICASAILGVWKVADEIKNIVIDVIVDVVNPGDSGSENPPGKEGSDGPVTSDGGIAIVDPPVVQPVTQPVVNQPKIFGEGPYPTNYIERLHVYVEKNYLALRTAMAYDYYNEIGCLYPGETVLVIEQTSGEYWYVYSEKLGAYGYVNANFLVP